MFGSFVEATILTGSILIVIMATKKNACYRNANIGNLHVESLSVNDLKVAGQKYVPNSDTGNNNTNPANQQLLQNILKELESLRQENNTLKNRLDNLKLNDLNDVDTVGREEDGAFIGWASSENSWVPYPEVGN